MNEPAWRIIDDTNTTTTAETPLEDAVWLVPNVALYIDFPAATVELQIPGPTVHQ